MHNNKYVLDLLGGRKAVAKIRLEAIKTCKAGIATARRVDRMLDAYEAERDEGITEPGIAYPDETILSLIYPGG